MKHSANVVKTIDTIRINKLQVIALNLYLFCELTHCKSKLCLSGRHLILDIPFQILDKCDFDF